MHLLKHRSDCEKVFRRIGGKTSRETLATERGHFAGKGIKSQFHGMKRRRVLTRQQGRPTRSQVIGEGRAELCNRRCKPRCEGLGQRRDSRRPTITRSWRNLSSVRNSGPVSGPTARPADRSCSASAPTAFICTKAWPMPS